MVDLEKVEKAAEKYAKREWSDAGQPGDDIVGKDMAIPFIDGAEWQANQSPWISVEERLPDTDNGQSLCEVLVKWDDRYSVVLNVDVEDLAKGEHITHWMPIPQ